MAVPDRTTIAAPRKGEDPDAMFARLLEESMADPQGFEKKYSLGPSTTGNPINLGPRLPEVADWVEDQIAGAQNNAEKWLRRTLAPRKSPKAQALKNAGRYKDGVQKALAAGKYEKGIAAIDEDAMVETINEGGSGVFSSGISRRRRKIHGKVSKLRAAQLAAVATLDAMPVDTLDQRKAKVIKNIDLMIGVGEAVRR